MARYIRTFRFFRRSISDWTKYEKVDNERQRMFKFTYHDFTKLSFRDVA